jgi:hypothetical protein
LEINCKNTYKNNKILLITSKFNTKYLQGKIKPYNLAF